MPHSGDAPVGRNECGMIVYSENMKITLLTVGKTTIPFVADGIREFLTRLKRFPTPFELRVVADVKTTRKTTESAQKHTEGEAILAAVAASDVLILLDEHGKEFTSREFAEFIEQKAVSGIKSLVFVVGGPYGFSPDVYARANGKISLSRMTFPHELIRLFFIEQLYRAFTISAHLPYHHD